MRDLKKMPWGELFIPLLAVFYMIYTLGYQFINNYKTSTVNYSLFLSIPVLVCACAIFIKVSTDQVIEEKKPNYGDYKKILEFLFVTITLIILINLLGYILAFFLYLISSLWLMGQHSIPKILAISSGVVLFIFIVFGIWLKLPLPTGIFMGGLF